MENIKLGGCLEGSRLSLGCWRVEGMGERDMERLVQTAWEEGITFYDTADIYGGGQSEVLLGAAIRSLGIRDQVLIQTKCGIRSGMYDFSKQHILHQIENSLTRLGMDYVDVLLLHRPDALAEPEEVAEVFDLLNRQGKVRYFGVSNHNSHQIALLQKYLGQKLIVDQLQFSLTNTGMIDAGLHVNMGWDAALDRDGGTLDYCRLHDITVQVFSPLQYGVFEGTFLDNDEKYPELNKLLDHMAEEKGVKKSAVSISWILRHPANMQVIIGTTKPDRIREISKSKDIRLSREEWYALYRSAGNRLP